MTRWRLTIEYDGGPFMGWQRQDNGPSVQAQLETAIQRMTGETAAIHGAGRTDSGVHALAMSAHVDIAKPLTAHRLRDGLNALVRPDPMAILAAEPVAESAPTPVVAFVGSHAARYEVDLGLAATANPPA